MLTQRLANCVFAIAIAAASIWFAMEAQGFKAAGLLASSGLPSKFFPQLTLAFTGIAAVGVFFIYLIRGHSGGDKDETVFNNGKEARQGLLMLVVTIVSYIVWTRFGFIPMAVIIGPLSLLAMGIRSIKIYVTVLLLTGIIYFVFTQFLNVRLT